ncbi:hypothetical protein M0R45_016923 [Rubus argutus]|uniref:Uncharacterized protein n=1 Tax=Rubus argutus TaxID=59490 RepID=A0AAW1XUH0_RUBAR
MKPNLVAFLQFPHFHNLLYPVCLQNVTPGILPVFEDQLMLGFFVTVVNGDQSANIAVDSLRQALVQEGQNMALDQIIGHQKPTPLSNVTDRQLLLDLPEVVDS